MKNLIQEIKCLFGYHVGHSGLYIREGMYYTGKWFHLYQCPICKKEYDLELKNKGDN